MTLALNILAAAVLTMLVVLSVRRHHLGGDR